MPDTPDPVSPDAILALLEDARDQLATYRARKAQVADTLIMARRENAGYRRQLARINTMSPGALDQTLTLAATIHGSQGYLRGLKDALALISGGEFHG